MDNNKMSHVTFSLRTEGQSRINTLIWTFPNFQNLLDNKCTKEIRSEKALVTGVKEVSETFQLKLQFLGRNSDLIEIYYLSRSSVFLKAALTICLRRFEERTIVIKDYHTILANKWQFLATLFNRDIAGEDDSYLLSDGSLRLKLQFYVNSYITVDHINIPEAQLSSDFENLLNNGLLFDTTMRSIEGNEYKVHKAILASRSVVLKAHFDHNTTECITNIIECHLESDVLQEVLTYIYSDKAPRVNEIPEKLLAAADYYQLKRLKSLSEEALNKKLTVENAVDTLLLADLHSAFTLKQLTLEFIKDGQAKLITETDGWSRIKSVELMKTIYEYIVDDNFEPDIK